MKREHGERLAGTTSPAVWRLREVLQRVGVSRSTLYRYVHVEGFPPPVRLGPNRVGWRVEEVEAWLASRPVSYVPRGRQSSSIARGTTDATASNTT